MRGRQVPVRALGQIVDQTLEHARTSNGTGSVPIHDVVHRRRAGPSANGPSHTLHVPCVPVGPASRFGRAGNGARWFQFPYRARVLIRLFESSSLLVISYGNQRRP